MAKRIYKKKDLKKRNNVDLNKIKKIYWVERRKWKD